MIDQHIPLTNAILMFKTLTGLSKNSFYSWVRLGRLPKPSYQGRHGYYNRRTLLGALDKYSGDLSIRIMNYRSLRGDL